MKALQKTQPVFGLELRDVPRPASPAPGEVIVEVLATGICGTDLHIYEWTAGYEVMTKAMPVTLGHEFSGTIAAVGAGVQSLRVGALVAIRPSVVCGRCPACLAGNSDACKNRKGIGVTRDGGLAKRVHVPAENCVLAPAGLDADIVALTEPMTVSAEAVATGEVRQGDRVLVLGPGNIGQGVALFAREVGAAQVVIVGKDDVLRLDVLRRMGFSETVDLGERTLPDALATYLEQGKFDVVIEATGVADDEAARQRLLAADQRLCKVTRQALCVGQVEADLRVLGLESQRPLVGTQRLLDLSKLQQHIAKVILRDHLLRIDLQCALVQRHCLRAAAQLAQRVGRVDERISIVRLQLQRAAQAHQCLLP